MLELIVLRSDLEMKHSPKLLFDGETGKKSTFLFDRSEARWSLKLLTGATWCNERKGKTGMVFLGNEGSCLVVWRLFRSELMVISLVGCGSGVWFIVRWRNSEKEEKMRVSPERCLRALEFAGLGVST
ncbi:hypothetical protein KY284_005464 [Solanum tuberosum]|nr:hypothetical protein KY284_005464 [Solanum tuberosum]